MRKSIHTGYIKYLKIFRRPDIRRAAQLLGWKPKISMLTGLSATIEYFKKELKHEEIKMNKT
jgi:UDP-glucuronate decarboxylase